MTVIAWDGTTLAADRRATLGGHTYATRKLFRIGDTLVGFSGSADRIGAYRAWLEAGRDVATYPKQEENSNVYFLVIHRDGTIERFEDTPWPIVICEPQAVLGSGRDYARAALHLGYDAVCAVSVACEFDESCGNGVYTLRFDAVGVTDSCLTDGG